MTTQGRTVAGDAPMLPIDRRVALNTFVCVQICTHGACATCRMNIVVNGGRTVIDEPSILKVTLAKAANRAILELEPARLIASHAIFLELALQWHESNCELRL